jgi:cobaltochelatase CobN
VILVLTNVETELLCLRAVVEGLPGGFPHVRAMNPDILDAAPDVDGATAVIVRLLGGRSAWREPFDALRAHCLARNVPLIALSGEAVPDAELTALSTVPAGLVTTAFGYVVAGGPENLEHLLRFVADTAGMHGYGFHPPVDIPATGVHRTGTRPGAPTVGVVFYRAHLLAGNTVFVDALCDAIEARGANAVAVWCYSLRPGADGRSEALDVLAAHGVDTIVTTVLAMGSADGDEWAVPQLAELDVPVVQSPSSSMPSADWLASGAGLAPLGTDAPFGHGPAWFVQFEPHGSRSLPVRKPRCAFGPDSCVISAMRGA